MCTIKFGHYDGKQLKTVLRETIFGPPKKNQKAMLRTSKKNIFYKNYFVLYAVMYKYISRFPHKFVSHNA